MTVGLKDVDGNEYETVQIGTQTWMAENLCVTRNPFGVLVISHLPNNIPNNVKEYGRLYDWETACKICPHGWHLPSDNEWTILEDALGDNAGGKMKDKDFWKHPNMGATNERGFSARPTGYWNESGFDNYFGLRGIFWSSTRQDAHFVWSRVLSFDNANLRRAPQHPQYGFSVRCVKD